MPYETLPKPLAVGDKFHSARVGADHYETLAIEHQLSTGMWIGVVKCEAEGTEMPSWYENVEEVLGDTEFNWQPWDGVSEVTLVPEPEAVPEVLKFGNWFAVDPTQITWFDDIDAASDHAKEVKLIYKAKAKFVNLDDLGHAPLVWNQTEGTLMSYASYAEERLKKSVTGFIAGIRGAAQEKGVGGLLSALERAGAQVVPLGSIDY